MCPAARVPPEANRPVAGSKTSRDVLAKAEEPPPLMRTLPLGSSDALCPPRPVIGLPVVLLQVPVAGL